MVERRKVQGHDKKHPAKSAGIVRVISYTLGALAVAAIGVFGLSAYFNASPPPVAQVEEDLHSGSIVFSMPNSDTCVRQQFDNATGQVRKNVVVDCEKLGGQKGQGTRIETIASGFRGR